MTQELEQECLDIYTKKVEETRKYRAALQGSLAEAEAEIASLTSALGEEVSFSWKVGSSLKHRISTVKPILEDLRIKKDLRWKEFSGDEVIDLSCESNRDKPNIPEVKDGPMTRSKARRLKEGFNMAVETLLSTMELGEMSRNTQVSTTFQESSSAPDLDLTEDFARLSLKEATPTETHCKSISLAGVGAKNIKISTKNTSELQDTSKTSNGSNKLQVEQEDKLEGNHVETLEDLHQLELKGLQEEETIKEIKLDGPDPDKTTSASSKLTSSQNQVFSIFMICAGKNEFS
ncbi:unnamed protein product [Arabidopsis halleri]